MPKSRHTKIERSWKAYIKERTKGRYEQSNAELTRMTGLLPVSQASALGRSPQPPSAAQAAH